MANIESQYTDRRTKLSIPKGGKDEDTHQNGGINHHENRRHRQSNWDDDGNLRRKE
ncbi:hypothetical protein MMON_37190 [Mycolicibacterium monacense]|uniref:Uncharacterized protein n=1 Tax=Mycolicibacterium monacense TaxID=85693 RepID=A0AAD1IXP4_MYCMB|nr:hypothetical protein MMON_37190 [Mycolicibacterium monacense]